MLSSGLRDGSSRRTVLTCQECLRRKQKCDRLRPCSNCVTRQVENRCLYNELPREQPKGLQAKSLMRDSPGTFGNFSSETLISRPSSTERLDISLFGYSRTNEHGTLASLVKLQSQFKDLDIVQRPAQSDGDLILKSQYEELVLRLPDKLYTTSLVALFFDNVNDWQYSILEPYFFQNQLDEWWSCMPHLPTIDHPRNLPNNDEYFPALLFQVIALSLQFLPATADINLEPLKQGKTLNALSEEYSHFGCALMTLLCRQHPNLSSIQHDLLRSAWLKNSGVIPESWHTLSQAIRQAQEIGLHEENKTKDEEFVTIADKLNQIWRQEYKKRVWLNLFMWDIQMAMMLGRPTTIDINACNFTPPMNCSIPPNPSETVPQPLREGDRPSPFTERLLQYQLTLQIIKMNAIRANRPFPRDPCVIDTLHKQTVSLMDSIPPSLRHQNPDTSWDSQCSFLPHQRELLLCGILFYLLALHRPHISNISRSRDIALQAAFMALESQQRLFKHLKPQYFKLHSITFFNFDACIQLSVILLTQPAGEVSVVRRALQYIGTAITRLEVLAGHSSLAKAGVPLIQTLYRRLQNNMCSAHERIDVPQLALLNSDLAIGSDMDILSGEVSDNYINGGLWTFDSNSAHLSFNFGQGGEITGSEAWDMLRLSTYPEADGEYLPYIPGQGMRVNNVSSDDPEVDLWAPMNEFTHEGSLMDER